MPDEQTPSADDLISRFRGSAEPVSYEGIPFEKDLNLSGIDIRVAVAFKNCTFKGTVDLSLAQTAASLDFSGSTFEKGLSLEGARIGHHLILDGCTFGSKPGKSNPTKAQQEPALNTWHTEINGDLLLRNNGKFYSHWLGRDMQIKGGFSIEGLTMEGEPRPVAQLTQTRVGGGMTIENGDFGELFIQVSRIGLGFMMRDSTFTGEANFVGTSIGGQANFKGVGFKAGVAFDGVEINGDIFMQPGGEDNPCVIEGEASFNGASIGGSATFKGVGFKDKVVFDQAKIEGSLFMQPGGKDNPCVIEGEANFNGASIAGQAGFKGVGFKDKVVFDQAKIEGGLFMQPGGKDNPCVIEGEASFNGASIASQAGFKGVSFKDKVVFDHAKIEGSLFMGPGGGNNPCVIEGEARFNGASIGGQANFLGVSFGRPVYFQGTKIAAEINICESTVPVLVADGSHFSKAMNIDAKSEINDLVLKDAQIGTLNINWESISGNLELTGSEYTSLENKEALRNILLKKGIRERQPYEFLESYCRRIGEGDEANDVYFDWRCLVAPHMGLSLKFIGDRLLRWWAGYGVRPHRMLYWLLGFFIFGVCLFKCPVMIVLAEAGQVTTNNIPSLHEAAWLSFVNLLPGIPSEYPEVVNHWRLTPAGLYIATGLRLLGWIVVSVGSLAATGLFSRYSP